ncbi:MAG: FHA domain-containing protein, partial [Verrucomicrobiota bacterium]
LNHSWAIDLAPGLNRIGRNPTNDFRIPDASVSSFHCEISVSADSVVVTDLGSTNGTFVDGQMIQQSELKPGQTLRLGQAEFKLERIALEIARPDSSSSTSSSSSVPASLTQTMKMPVVGD